jgi:hypothetical protein
MRRRSTWILSFCGEQRAGPRQISMGSSYFQSYHRAGPVTGPSAKGRAAESPPRPRSRALTQACSGLCVGIYGNTVFLLHSL